MQPKNEQTEVGRICQAIRAAIPQVPPDIIEWARGNVILPSSARSRYFNIDITPWLREPLQRATDLETRMIDFRKPVQSGGSVLGEVLLMYWITHGRGFLQYNWSNDKRANERWNSRILAILKANSAVRRWMDANGYMRGEVDFGNVFFRMQGAFIPDNLDSDSVRLQINEELHSWEAGHLKKARNRLTAVWDYKSVNISNAGVVGDQFDVSHKNGTNQVWTVKCPGCGKYHAMRTRWEPKKPHLGGLRYDADGCRLGKFQYNYNKLRPTIHYQMPCGFRVQNNDLATRRALSLSGVYSEPTNPGAELSHRSYTYEAVSVDFIDWMSLIKDKHDALRARATGDPEPWICYCQGRECIPYDPDDVPITNVIEVKPGLKKNRDGLDGKKLRAFALDRQHGEMSKGELPHWWLVIRDAQITEDGVLRSLLVWEGKVETDDQVVAILREHGCMMWQGVADSGDDTYHVYSFCLYHGINCIKGGKEDHYSHEGGARRIFSSERPLARMLNRQTKFPTINVAGKIVPDPREPLFWLYSKAGIRERLHFLRSSTEYLTPEDVSEDYRAHMDAEEREKTVGGDGSISYRWVQRKSRNDLFVCEAYIAMLFDQAGIIRGKLDQRPVENS